MPSSTKATLLKAEASGKRSGQKTLGTRTAHAPQGPSRSTAEVSTPTAGRHHSDGWHRLERPDVNAGRRPLRSGSGPNGSGRSDAAPRRPGPGALLAAPATPARRRKSATPGPGVSEEAAQAPERVAGDGALRPRTLTRLRGSRIGEAGERAVPAYFLRSGPSPLPLGQPPRPRHLETSRPSAILTSLPVPAADALTALLRPGTIERTKRRQGQSCFRSNPTSDWITVGQESASFRSIVDWHW